MIDLHTHSIFSDGELIPSELARRAQVAGYRAIGITDHGDQSNIDFIVQRLVKVCRKLTDACDIQVIPGIELTHVPPQYITDLAVEARQYGAKIIVVHGETIVEPVIAGTNMAALTSPIDILAHPGLITEEETMTAARNSIYLEITTRKGHSLTNGHVARMARLSKAQLILNNDAHASQDLVSKEMAIKIALGTGMTGEEADIMFRNSEILAKRAIDK